MRNLVLAIIAAFCACVTPAYADKDIRSALVPADVRAAIAGLGGKATQYCKRPKSLTGYLSVRPVSQIIGYNSRMDNVGSVPGARQMEAFVLDVSAAATYAFVSGDTRVKDEIVDVLAHWARSAAYVGTKSCVRGGRLIESCSYWARADGQDLSSMKDFDTVQMAVASLQRAYYFSVYNHAASTRASDHEAIREWFGIFNKRMKSPSSVYFGLGVGWYWPAIDAATGQRGTGAARTLAGRAGRGLASLYQADGSIRDITSRGNRALHYQNSAINETILTMEMMRASGAPIPSSLEAKLHAAVRLFIAAVANPSTLDPWARQSHNSVFVPGRQEWRSGWADQGFAGSWWHIYPYRYPERDEAKWLRKSVRPTAGSARSDAQVGVGLGCIYDAALRR